ncbi:MAG: hypothetical protein IT226_14755 [Flavobacteriales bacterium]|nr:hypothetical protein [Flavobacteriales bacterium]
MRTHHLSLLTGSLVALLFACSSAPTTDDIDRAADPTSTVSEEVAVKCDPIVEEYRDLMADYEAGLKEMVAAKKVDAERQKQWMEKGEDLSKRVEARGEKELGMKCWQEFNTIAQTYAPRIAQLGMELTMIQVGDKMDPATKAALEKAMKQ